MKPKDIPHPNFESFRVLFYLLVYVNVSICGLCAMKRCSMTVLDMMCVYTVPDHMCYEQV